LLIELTSVIVEVGIRWPPQGEDTYPDRSGTRSS
jgi:hypothetical protein